MAKASINKKYSLNASGILDINENVVCIENESTGEMIQLSDLFEDFNGRTVKLSITYDEDYLTVEE